MLDHLTVLRLLEDEAYRFDFFQAVRLIENAWPERPRVGESLRPRDDAVRFTQRPELVFHPTTLAAFSQHGEGRAPRLAVNFFGLLGPHGALPTHLTEYIRDRERNADDPTFARFLDLFQHRMVSLFYRAWANAQPAVSLERPGRDRFAMYVGATFGMGETAQRERDAVPDFAKLHFAGLLGAPTRSASGLALILTRFFRLPVSIEQWVGHWMPLPAESRTRMGARDGSSALGVSTLLGARVWDCQHKFRVVIGPLSLADYERFLPGGESLKRLVDWVRNYVRDGLDWDVNLQLREAEVPRLKLGAHARLGLTSWVLSGAAQGDQRQLKLNPASGAAARTRHGVAPERAHEVTAAGTQAQMQTQTQDPMRVPPQDDAQRAVEHAALDIHPGE
ncbi:type VI secretion system baseplate subunit TssG [Paraburkholderia pallida]|uniref:Type VI secretion system baseplate subunit TssG n=1 Tax=Paraburkholderia pallida TaxID=2547399 RepID=A0A4P7CXN0_9BURK|nr:type VI secretion system baseplate subunit TssG [Paraburkholderia pallida]QBQ98974.1 type VI secretion system baseplate subunit TssG [Paraburkholderia pallida]